MVGKTRAFFCIIFQNERGMFTAEREAVQIECSRDSLQNMTSVFGFTLVYERLK